MVEKQTVFRSCHYRLNLFILPRKDYILYVSMSTENQIFYFVSLTHLTPKFDSNGGANIKPRSTKALKQLLTLTSTLVCLQFYSN